jgi:hypothetical protein
MAPVVPLPTGNVAVVDAPPGSAASELPKQRAKNGQAEGPEADGPSEGWSIRTGAGEVVTADIPNRATASRLLGILAAHGTDLPLLVYAPNGKPSGERLG